MSINSGLDKQIRVPPFSGILVAGTKEAALSALIRVIPKIYQFLKMPGGEQDTVYFHFLLKMYKCICIYLLI